MDQLTALYVQELSNKFNTVVKELNNRQYLEAEKYLNDLVTKLQIFQNVLADMQFNA